MTTKRRAMRWLLLGLVAAGGLSMMRTHWLTDARGPARPAHASATPVHAEVQRASPARPRPVAAAGASPVDLDERHDQVRQELETHLGLAFAQGPDAESSYKASLARLRAHAAMAAAAAAEAYDQTATEEYARRWQLVPRSASCRRRRPCPRSPRWPARRFRPAPAARTAPSRRSA